MSEIDIFKNIKFKNHIKKTDVIKLAFDLALNNNKGVPIEILNSEKISQKIFLDAFIKKTIENKTDINKLNKMLQAGLLFLKNNSK